MGKSLYCAIAPANEFYAGLGIARGLSLATVTSVVKHDQISSATITMDDLCGVSEWCAGACKTSGREPKWCDTRVQAAQLKTRALLKVLTSSQKIALTNLCSVSRM